MARSLIIGGMRSSKRHESLIPLSHQHHHGLVLSHRVLRDLPGLRGDSQALALVAGEVVEFFERDLLAHFAAEEEVLFPAMEQQLGKLTIIDELLGEHRQMRVLVQELSRKGSGAKTVEAFAELLRDHIRKEERDLFPIYDQRMSESAQSAVGDGIRQRLAG
jgi:iron-sulfur cluster repair protein YtfE (RIC family)